MKLSELKRYRDGVARLSVASPGRAIGAPQSDDDHWTVCHGINKHFHRIDAEDISVTWEERRRPYLGTAFRSLQFAPAGPRLLGRLAAMNHASRRPS